MKTKKEFSKPENVIQNKAAIHYVVRGRKLRNNTSGEDDFFEEFFFNEQPIIAREQAFSFYQNYVLILEEHKLLFQKQLPTPVTFLNDDFGGNDIQKYSTATVTYHNPNLFDNGITIYMVVEKPISYMDKTDEKGDRFLIHGIWNFDETDMKNMIDGLIREYGYYAKFRSDLKNYTEIVNFSAYNFKGNPKYSIISTPFDWNFNYFLNEKREIIKTNNRLRNYKYQIEKGTLDRNAFETRMDKNKLVRTIASFLNTNGGMLFYGINEFRQSENVFKKVKPAIFKKEINLLLRQKFPAITGNIVLRFIKVGVNVVAVFSISSNRECPVFVKENNSKKFYIRDDNGMKLIKDPEDIFSYSIGRDLRTSKTIQQILDRL